DLAVEALAVDPEQPRGLVLVAAALAQRGGEQPALGLLERRHVAQIQGGSVGGREPAHGGGQVVERDRLGRRERERALDRVLELAHVAGPGVGAQALHHLGGEALRRHLVLAAARKTPSGSCTAPVNAPRRWPKSWLSSSVSESPAQLMATKGWAASAPRSWMVRATSSFPVPLSPLTRTVLLFPATVLMTR